MSMQEEKPTGYQSSEYKDTKTEDKFNDPIEGYHSQTESIMKATPSHEYSIGGGFGRSQYVLEELVPSQRLQWYDFMNPMLKNYLGIGLSRIYFYLGYALSIITTMIMVIYSIVTMFQVHWALGLLSIPVCIVVGILSLAFVIIGLRLIVELVISIFVIRQNIGNLANK